MTEDRPHCGRVHCTDITPQSFNTPACKCDGGGGSGDDNDINGCPKTSPKKFPYFIPWASVGRAWH